jgi:O-acetyl-ADP-ribose deacetylase (regulator of RNase III)
VGVKLRKREVYEGSLLRFHEAGAIGRDRFKPDHSFVEEDVLPAVLAPQEATSSSGASTRSRRERRHGVIEAVRGDITEQGSDAIVNAANSSLLGGGGVDGAIHRTQPRAARRVPHARAAAGRRGEATAGYGLARSTSIHTVALSGWAAARRGRAARCLPRECALPSRRSFGCRTVAFPAISTGIFGYPAERAAQVAVAATLQGVGRGRHDRARRFVLFDERRSGSTRPRSGPSRASRRATCHPALAQALADQELERRPRAAARVEHPVDLPLGQQRRRPLARPRPVGELRQPPSAAPARALRDARSSRSSPTGTSKPGLLRARSSSEPNVCQ